MFRNKKRLIIAILCLAGISAFFFFTRHSSQNTSSDIKNMDWRKMLTANNSVTGNETGQNDEAVSEDANDKPGEYLDQNDENDQEDEEGFEEYANDRDLPEGKENFLNVKKKDCDDNCNKYKDNGEDLKYCREVCGLDEVAEKKNTSECEDKEGLEMDYCFRDVAVSKNDYSICDKIEDAGITKMCQNRIAENLIKNSAE